MSICTIIGDSIALGISLSHPGCATDAIVGRPSIIIAHHVPTRHYEWAVISSGSNDPKNPDLLKNLTDTREKLRADKVVWILPVNKRARSMVFRAASQHGDPIVGFTPGRDHVHPRSYQALWRNVKPLLVSSTAVTFGQ